MSNRICHACISFLNSWQSFKNRCYAAQKKQQNFLDLLLAKERAKQKLENERQRLIQPAAKVPSIDNDAQRILKNALLNSTMRPNSINNSSIDIVSFFFLVDFELIKSIRTKNTFRDLFEMHDDIKKIDSIINVK